MDLVIDIYSVMQTYERALCQRFNAGEMGSYKIDLIMMHDYICRFNIIKCVRLKNLHEKYVCDNCFNCKVAKASNIYMRASTSS